MVASPAEASLEMRPLRISIQPLVLPPLPPADFADRAWQTLQAAVRAVNSKTALPSSQEALYRLVEAVCVSGGSALLAQRLLQECEAMAALRLAALAAGAADACGSADLLTRVEGAWLDHCSSMRSLCAFFAHLDRTHIAAQGGVIPSEAWAEPGQADASGADPMPLLERGVQLFRKRLDLAPAVRDGTLQGVLDDVDEERSAHLVARPCSQRPRLKNLVAMFAKVGLYEALLEPALLERTTHYYGKEAKDFLPVSEAAGAAEHIAHCEGRLKEEQRRCDACFESSTAAGILARTREELIKKRSGLIVERGVPALVAAHRVEELQRLHTLFAQVGELGPLRKAWAQAIQEGGADIMRKANDPEESRSVTPALCDYWDRLNEIHCSSFQKSAEFGIAFKDAFEGFLNSGAPNLPAKLLARHIDEVLRDEPGGVGRSGAAASSGDSMERDIGRPIGLFRFLSAKDAFEALYKKDLAKRLLQQSSASADVEAMVVLRLRHECGSAYTSKLEGMLRDVEVSKGFAADFAAAQGARAPGAMDFSVSVIATGLWPTQPPSPEVIYPDVPKALQEKFDSFYAARFTGRSLRWSPLLGQCVLRANYAGGIRRELVVSVLQAIVCLLFNTEASLSTRAIAERTKLPEADLHRTLQSLALHKHIKVLCKSTKSRDIAEEDVFSVNVDMVTKLHRVVVPQIQVKGQQEEEAAVEQRVFEDRQHEVDAMLVRIMKTKKRLSHKDLLAEVFGAVRFPVQLADVKNRIETLIEREYLKRDEDHPSMYAYLA